MKLAFNPLVRPCAVIAAAFVMMAAGFGCSNDGSNPVSLDPEYGTMTDIDGNTYITVKIGNQWWMAENLKVTHYRNGQIIQQVTDDGTWSSLDNGAYCCYNNNTGNVAVYGLLYNWYAAADSRNIAPDGWHVPSKAEWETLVDLLGGENAAGGKMKEEGTAHWVSPNTGGTNESGFMALPGGYRWITGMFAMMGYKVWFLSSTSYDSENTWAFNIDYDSSKGRIAYIYKQQGYSVRCVKD